MGYKESFLREKEKGEREKKKIFLPFPCSLRVPSLVIHGNADKMIDVSGGQATAAAIPGAELVIIDGMGHGLPKPLWPELATRIANLIHQVEASII